MGYGYGYGPRPGKKHYYWRPWWWRPWWGPWWYGKDAKHQPTSKKKK